MVGACVRIDCAMKMGAMRLTLRIWNVLVLSDEIHCDITQMRYTPFVSVQSQSITAISPSKAFNLAGLHAATLIIPDTHLRSKIVHGLNNDEIIEPNAFAIESSIAAYTQCGSWLERLNVYIAENKRLTREFIQAHTGFSVPLSEATYLLWVDCASLGESSDRFCAFLREHTGLILSRGWAYRGNGAQFVRMNLGTSRARVLDGLQRLERGYHAYLREG